MILGYVQELKRHLPYPTLYPTVPTRQQQALLFLTLKVLGLDRVDCHFPCIFLVSSFKFLFEHVFMKICRNKAAICGWIFKLPDIFFFLSFYATFLRDCRDCRALQGLQGTMQGKVSVVIVPRHNLVSYIGVMSSRVSFNGSLQAPNSLNSLWGIFFGTPCIYKYI